jgi:transmembrane sensor
MAPASASAPRAFPVRRLLSGAFAAAALAFGAFWFTHRPEEFSTQVAQRQHITLADGSHADLNARTRLSARMRGRDRHVRLEQGEAYFEVAKDPARPFYVETAAGTVRVTGTKFNVRTSPTGLLEVTVLEGSVNVATAVGAASRRAATGDADFHLKPQDQVTVTDDVASEQRLTASTTDDVIAWRDGKVAFDDTPLAVAAERFAAYNGRTVTVAPEAAGLRLGGRYTLDDFDRFLVSLEKALPVKALRGENGAVRIVAVPPTHR